ncbi:MAG: NCS2 family permease [Deltaproteobacteria bacterium]|nr:MAG: NCS2 family permease [Deltaproteobacteria bacterium]
MLDRFFHLRARRTSLRTEILGGVTTFVTLSYVVFVQPAVLATTGMEPGAVLVATCLASAFATLLMGLWARYPIAVAPAMGHNFYFAFTVAGPVAAGGLGYGWQVALGANCLAGVAFLVLSLVGLRERLIDAIPDSLKHAIAAGIGLLIALVGFEWAGIVRPVPGTIIGLGRLAAPPTLVAIGGTLLTAALLARRAPGAIVIGTLATGLAAGLAGFVRFHGILAPPPSLAPTFARLDLGAALWPDLVHVVFVLFFLGLFDTVGTLVGVAEQAGFLVESAAGVQAGARTGLASVVTAGLFLVALFCAPLARMAGQGVPVGDATLHPIVAPALIMVGSFMMRSVARIDLADPPAAVASFLTLVTMPFAFSITEGIAFGFIAYAALMLAAGRGREVHPLLYLFAALFAIRYAYLT